MGFGRSNQLDDGAHHGGPGRDDGCRYNSNYHIVQARVRDDPHEMIHDVRVFRSTDGRRAERVASGWARRAGGGKAIRWWSRTTNLKARIRQELEDGMSVTERSGASRTK